MTHAITVDDGKTNSAELEQEVVALRRRVAELEQVAAGRSEVEKALRESEEKYRNTMDTGLVGIYVIQDLLFRYVNPKMAEMFGYRVEELENRLGPVELVAEVHREQVRENLLRRAEGEPGIPYEIKCQRKDGSLFDATVWGKATTFDGKPASVGSLADTTALKNAKRELLAHKQRLEEQVAAQTHELMESNIKLQRDIAKRKRMERSLFEAKETAERANQAKTRFLAAANHDLRQPLQALTLLISALQLKHPDAQIGQILHDMLATVQVMETLLNSLLDISKLDAGGFRPDIRSFAAAPFLQEMRNQFKAQAAEQDTRIRLFPCNATLHTDPDLLARIMQNLISNAVRHTCGGRILIGCRRSGAMRRIEVWDQGEGIPADQLDTIFEEFYQLGNPARNRHQGLGLGLTIAMRMAKLLGLSLQARSRLGRGSVFTLEVPVGNAGAVLPGRDEPVFQTGTDDNGTLLLVDDDENVLKASVRVLELWGFRVLTATDAAQALALCRAHAAEIDMALLDYRLPDGWTGVKLIARINRELGRKLPGILITGDTSAKQLRDVYASGLPLMHKPIDPSALRRTIASLLALEEI